MGRHALGCRPGNGGGTSASTDVKQIGPISVGNIAFARLLRGRAAPEQLDLELVTVEGV